MASPAPTPQQVLEAMQARAAGKKLVLHLGCGTPKEQKLHKEYRGAEWFEVRCDINRAVKPHILADMTSLHMIPDHAVDAIWNSHALEHLEAHQVMGALKEWYRVLKNEGELRMSLPDMRAVATHVAHGRLEEPLYNSPVGAITALDMIYGYGPDIEKGNKFMAHRTGFTAETLGKKMADAGFSAIRVDCKELALWAVGYKYPEGHAKQVNRIRIGRPEGLDIAPPPAPPLSTQKHPGQLWEGKRPDELDVPPAVVK